MAEQIKGMRQLQSRLDNISDTREILLVLQRRTVEESKRLTVPFRKTGNLGRSIRPGFLSAKSAFVNAEASYAAYVEKGTGIYGPKHKPIVPRKAKVLAWRTGATTLSGRSRVKGGVEQAGWAFARSVKGRKPTPFLEPGARKAIEKSGLKDVVVKLWNEGA
jgi:hypothetical protein